MLRWCFPIDFFQNCPMKFFNVAKNGWLKPVWIPVALTKVQPVCLAWFLRRNDCIALPNNVEDQLYYYSSSDLQLYSQLPSASKKKLRVLFNQFHPQYETLNLIGCQSSFKSLTFNNGSNICAFSTNWQLYMKDQNSQATICKPKGTARSCSAALPLHAFLQRCGLD